MCLVLGLDRRVEDVDGRAIERDAADERLAAWHPRRLVCELLVLGVPRAVEGDGLVCGAVPAMDGAALRFAEAGRGLEHRVEDRLDVLR